MKNPPFLHPFHPKEGKLDRSNFSRIEVDLPHETYDRLKFVLTSRSDLITIAAMFLAHVEREIILHDYSLIDRDTVISHICSRCAESGPGQSELCSPDKLARSDGGRTSCDSSPLPQQIHLNNDSAREQPSEKRTKRKERKHKNSSGESSSVV